MTTITIRTVIPADAAPLARLMTQLGYPTSPQEMTARLQSILARPEYRTLIAELDGKVIGMAGVGITLPYERNGVDGRLLALVVDEQARGRGIGAALVRAAERWLAGQGAGIVIVNSSTHRTGAHDFYHRLGYRTTGLRLVKSLQPGEDLPVPAGRPGDL